MHMTRITRLELGLAVFLVIMFLVPVGMIIFLSGEVPYRVITGEPVNAAAQAAGVTVTSVKDMMWNLTGATGGKTYTLTDRSGEVVTIATQNFDSAESRDAAIRLYNSHPLGKGKPVGSLLVIGQQLVYVTPANSAILDRIAPELKKYAVP
jgi:hypothetical protein